MEFLRSFLRRHLVGKPVVASPNVGCFLMLGEGKTKRSQIVKECGVEGWPVADFYVPSEDPWRISPNR